MLKVENKVNQGLKVLNYNKLQARLCPYDMCRKLTLKLNYWNEKEQAPAPRRVLHRPSDQTIKYEVAPTHDRPVPPRMSHCQMKQNL